ncbi:MAG TPA: FUSC family protein [Bacteroidota bacterium]|nr:FUSC family protein [Bacteroidota bacterium]
MRIRPNTLLLYIVKCVTGVLLVVGLATIIHYPDYAWCLISVMLVLSPDSKEAMPLAMTRMKANLTGSTASMLCLLVFPPNLVAVSMAVALSITLCYAFNVMASSRSALAAVIIVMAHSSGSPVWDVALERVVSVMAGCLLGVAITYAFHKKIWTIADIDPVEEKEEKRDTE